MTIALWIIAMCEVIRMLQNALQLYMSKKATSEHNDFMDRAIDNMRKDNREWAIDTLNKFLEEHENDGK